MQKGLRQWEIYSGRVDFYETKFTRPIPEEEQDELFTKPVRNLFKSAEWKISTNNFQLDRWNRVLSIVKESPAKTTILDGNARPTIIKEIRHIAFINMNLLQLRQNLISNIESIAHLNAPFLNKLDLSHNKIRDVNSLRKSSFKHLKSLSLYSNLIHDYSPLALMKTAKIFVNFRIQMYSDELRAADSITWLFKVEASTMLCLDLVCRNTVNQFHLVKMFEAKFPEIQVTTWKGLDSDFSDSDDSQT